jgi:uncharacterized protein (DUF1330 family)
MPKAYVISEVMIVDEMAADQYRRLAADSIAEYGGRYLVRGAAPEVLEGAPGKHQLVVVEFPSEDRARTWYASPSYARALAVRDQALVRRLTLVVGADG